MPNIIEVQTTSQKLINKKITYADGFYNLFCDAKIAE